jgi:putative NIF3 family GTP cyclohydrolase 1 type 2
MMKAIKNDLCVYASHTNLDNARSGVNYKIAEMLGLQQVRILSPQKGKLLKLVTFVPDAYANLSAMPCLMPERETSAITMLAATT